MKIRPLITVVFILSSYLSFSQVTYTANDQVTPYTAYFQYGTNMGYYGSSWNDQALADISAGSVPKNIKGAGCKTLRLFLPEDFLETWGYDIRTDAFNYYDGLGISEKVVALEQPSAAHVDLTNFGGCADHSNVFKNLYSPVWDGGANGTPVNDTNYFALYVYKTVTRYKSNTRFWEIINEPDMDYVGHSEQQPGQPGNWWENNPNPCDLANVKAPIFYYIRMLRIAYDVIKTLDPTAYIAPGGLGHPSFLDAVLRNTDNPVDGSVTSAFPLKGGAYFDVMSFHSYPEYTLKTWDNTIMGFVFRRHSDAAAAEYLAKMNSMKQVLLNYGYDNVTFPSKVFICTESNIAHLSFTDYSGISMIGSYEAQKNYEMKALVLSQKNNVGQFYSFVLGDTKNDNNATNELDVMGLYKNLTDIGPLYTGGVYNQQYNDCGIAYKTTSDLLHNRKYDATRTAALNLPANIDGAAFKDTAGNYAYVLWAKTTIDMSESAAASYTFPAALNPPTTIAKFQWDYAITGINTSISTTNVALTGTPIFLMDNMQFLNLHDDSTRRTPSATKAFKVSVYPNPASIQSSVEFTLNAPSNIRISLVDGNGRTLSMVTNNERFTTGSHKLSLTDVATLPSGVYYIKFETEIASEIRKLVIVK
jgi:hypothetical protein